MEGQCGGDVLVVRGGNGDGVGFILRGRDVRVAVVFQSTTSFSIHRHAYHHRAVAGCHAGDRSIGGHLPFREKVCCRQSAGLRSAAALDDVYGLGCRSGIVRQTDGDFLCGAGNVLIVIAAGLGRGDGHRTRLRGMQLAAVNDRRFAGAVRHGVGHRTSAAAATSGQRQVCAVGRVSGGHGQWSLLGLGDGGPGDRQHLGVCQRIVAGGDGSGGKDNLLCLVDIGAVVFQRAADSEGIAAHQRIGLHRNGEAAGGIGAAVIDLGDRAGIGQIILRQRLGFDDGSQLDRSRVAVVAVALHLIPELIFTRVDSTEVRCLRIFAIFRIAVDQRTAGSLAADGSKALRKPVVNKLCRSGRGNYLGRRLADDIFLRHSRRQFVVLCLVAGQTGGGCGMAARRSFISTGNSHGDRIAVHQIARCGGDGLVIAKGAVFGIPPVECDLARLDVPIGRMAGDTGIVSFECDGQLVGALVHLFTAGNVIIRR